MPDGFLGSGLVAEFASAGDLGRAIRALRARGYTRLDASTPYAVPGIANSLAIPRSRLPRIVLIASLCGAVFGYLVQWFTDAWLYPLDAGGRPAHAIPSFIFITFESMVLCGALAATIGLFWRLGLPRLWRPMFELEGAERASTDRYWLGVAREDPLFDAKASLDTLVQLSPLRILDLTGEEAS